MTLSSLRRAAAILAVLATAGSLAAQIPTVPAAFPNVTQVPGTLLYRSPGETNRITNIAYHNGIFYTNMVTGSDRRVWRFTDTTNAASLTQDSERNNDNIPLLNDQGNHAHTMVGDFMGGVFQIGIRRSTPGVNITSNLPEHTAFATPAVRNLNHGLYWPWFIPFHWIQYGGLDSPTPTRIIRPNAAGTASQTLFEWNSLIEDGVTGNSILLGNLLFITSDESNLGVLCYDISPVFQTPAGRPILLDKLTGSFGAYIAAPFENYLILSSNHTKKVEVIDYSDPTDLRHVASIDVTGLPDRTGSTSVSYIQAQDNFVFAQRHKIDMTNFTPVLQLDQVGNNRPTGSVTGAVDTSQYMLPLGNLLVTAGYSFADSDRLAVWAHQAAPDTRKPYVGYHIPRPGQTNYPLGAPISLLIHETLASFTIINGETVIVREVGTTTPLDCWISFSHDDVLTITPKSYLALNKTYEVIIVADGIKDAVGNGIEPYSFTFSTGSSLAGGNAGPTLSNFTAGPSPAPIGSTVTFTASATDAENDALEYRFTFGDATPTTAWSSSATATRTYTTKGHFIAKVQVRDLKPDGTRSTVSKDLTVTIADPITATLPRNSSSIAIDAAARRVWSVNPDADTVTVLNADTRAKLAEYNLQALLGLSASTTVDPRSVAIDASGRAWIACHDADRIVVLSTTGTLVQSIATGYGSAPIGIAITPNGTSAFATLTGSGVVKRYSTSSFAETGSLAVGPTPRAIAITGDSSRVLVTRYISDFDRAHVWDISNANAGSLSLTRTWMLERDRTPDNSADGRGIPNQLAGITLSPDSRWAWVTASKMNDQHGLLFTGHASTDNGVRALVLRLDLTLTAEGSNSIDRLDVDNSESPTAVVFSPLGDWAFVALQGNNQVAVYDDIALQSGSSKTTRWRFDADLAPQGMALDATTRTLFVNNFMARTVTTHDLTGFFAQGTRNANTTSRPAVTTEKLTPTVLTGKQTFYNASLKDILNFDAMSRDTYVSCASCHNDGGTDNRVWDFTQRGEGLRNTTDLRGRSGMGHGNVHWSANFDEIQDFENDIRDHFGGTGLINAVDVSGPLGTPKAGLSPQLDALAAYVTSLGNTTYPKSPHRNPSNGTETAAAISGREIFQAQSCTDCHSGSNFTDSSSALLLRDVGTLRTSSGGRLGSTLLGIDTPTLIGIHATAPYFHDGSARTLEDVFTVAGGRVYQAESGTIGAGVRFPGFISQNHFNQPRAGGMVSWDDNGTWTLSNVDGGPGGIGALEFLFSLEGTRTLTVNVNGTNYTSSLVGQNPSWPKTHYVPHRIENVSLNAGLTNTISITSTSGLVLDQVTVSTAADLAKAQPHRRVLALPTAQRSELLAYLRQLDGSSAPAGFSPAPVVTASQTASGTVGAALSYQVAASNTPTSYTLASGSLPAGVSLDTTTGQLSGTPTAGGTFTLSFTATNAGGTSAPATLTLSIASSSPLTGTYIGSTGSWNNDLSRTGDKAFDGNTATFFDAPTGNGAWVGLDLGATYQITQIRFSPRSGWGGRMNGGKFQGSSTADFTSNVMDLATLTTDAASGYTTLTVTVTTAFRYVRYLSPNGGYGNVSEVEFRGFLTSALQTFRTTYGLASNGSQDTATPAGDGVANLLKYAFNMIGSGSGQASLTTPNTTVLAPAGSAGMPVGSAESGTEKLQITFIRRKADSNPGITYAVEFSDALTTWGGNSSATESVTSISGEPTLERVTVTDDSGSPTKRFVRVSVSTN